MPDHDRPTPVDGPHAVVRDTPPPALPVHASPAEVARAYRVLAAWAVRNAGLKPWERGILFYCAAAVTLLVGWDFCVHLGSCK